MLDQQTLNQIVNQVVDQLRGVKLRERETLRQSEYATAIMAAVSDDTNAGETRKFTIAELAEISAIVAPATPTWERTTLFDGDATGEKGSSDTSFGPTAHNLDFKSGSSGPRHDFTDGYQFFVIKTTLRSGTLSDIQKLLIPQFLIPSILITDSAETNPVSLWVNNNTYVSILYFIKSGNTSFKIAGGDIDGFQETSGRTGGVTYAGSVRMIKIEGLKMVIQPSSL